MDDRQFRNAMGKFATGVTVILTEVDGMVHGMTANAFMSVSLSPKLVVISISEKAKILDKIKQSETFTVNILNKEQEELSKVFAGQIKENRDLQFERVHEMPVIQNALVQVACVVKSEHVEGDHTLFIGEVKDINIADGEPLIFYNGQYRSLSEKVHV